MADYPLTNRQRQIIHSLQPWLRDGSLPTEWIVFLKHDGTIASIDGLDRQGLLWRSAWRETRKSDLDKFVEVGFMRELGVTQEGGVRYSLDEFILAEAIRTNFRRSDRPDPEVTETYNITVTNSIFNFKSFLSNVTQQLNASPNLNADVKAELLNEMQQLTELLRTAPLELEEDVDILTGKLTRLADELSADPPDTKRAVITAEGLKNAAKSLILVLPAASVIIEKIAELVRNIGS